MKDLGRGSPVGVEFYQHDVYPPEYQDAFLAADWSRGRILIAKPVRDGATYKTAGEPREFVHGEPLNVTDLEVGPDGFVYFSTGGRDTEGGVYRVRYNPTFWQRLFDRREKPEGILAVVRQPQPLSSWGHEALTKAKDAMGGAWGAGLQQLARDTSARVSDRVQALLLLQRTAPKPNADLLRPLTKDPDPAMRGAAIYVVGQHGSDRAKAIAAGGLKDPDPFVRRRAADAVVRMGLSADQPSFAPVEDVYAVLSDGDRFVRYAGRVALERIPREEWEERALADGNPLSGIEAMLALVRTAPPQKALEPLYGKQLAMLTQGQLAAEDTLRLLRVFHLTAIRSKEGAPAAVRRQVHEALAGRFPGEDERLNREFARTLAYCGQTEAIGEILAAMPEGDANQPLQIHYAYCLRALRNGWTAGQKAQLTAWFQKAAGWRGGASFTGYINRMFDSSLGFFDAEEKKAAYARVPQFAPVDPKLFARRGRSGFTPASVSLRQRGSEGLTSEEIFEHQIYSPMILMASPAKGKEIFDKECASCHRFGSAGKDFGPDLTTLKNRFKRKDTLEALLWPSKTISDQYASIIVETKRREIINGLLVSDDGKRMVLKTAEVERPVEILKSDVRERRPSKISIMPEGLVNSYSLDQISDLLAYLEQGAKQ
jgi:putative heme-binding domain-containing protein